MNIVARRNDSLGQDMCDQPTSSIYNAGCSSQFASRLFIFLLMVGVGFGNSSIDTGFYIRSISANETAGRGEKKATRKNELLWTHLRHIQQLGREARDLHAEGNASGNTSGNTPQNKAAIEKMRSALREARLLYAYTAKDNSEDVRYIAWLASLSLSDVALDIGESSLKTNNVRGAKISSEILTDINSALNGPENILLRWVMKLNSNEQSRFAKKWTNSRSKQMDWSLVKAAWNNAKNMNEQSLVVAKMWLDVAKDTKRASQWKNVPYRLFVSLTERRLSWAEKKSGIQTETDTRKKPLVVSGKPTRDRPDQSTLNDKNDLAVDNFDDIHIQEPEVTRLSPTSHSENNTRENSYRRRNVTEAAPKAQEDLVALPKTLRDLYDREPGRPDNTSQHVSKQILEEFVTLSRRTALGIRKAANNLGNSATDISDAFTAANSAGISKLPGPIKAAVLSGK